jgi:signal transduction histidine kinase
MGATERTRGAGRRTVSRATAVVRYGVVGVVAALAVALGETAARSWHLRIHFVTFYLALVMVGAWTGGLWAGVLSTLVCSLAAVYFWAEPTHNLVIESRNDAISITLFFLLGVMISLLCEQLHAARRAEHKARRMREETLAVVAHELKNPLGAIQVALSLLDMQAPSGSEGDRHRAIVARIRRMSSEMDRLVRDLLDAAAIEAGALSIVKAPEPVESLLQEAREAHLGAAASKRISLEIACSPGCPPVLCDRARVLQTLSNLIGNAVKFTPEGGSVRVRADAVADGVRFSVSDTGPGIPANQLALLFVRYAPGERRAGSETGLGLYIAQGIVRSHEGRSIVVSSRPGEGSTFSFILSRAPDTEAAVATQR